MKVCGEMIEKHRRHKGIHRLKDKSTPGYVLLRFSVHHVVSATHTEQNTEDQKSDPSYPAVVEPMGPRLKESGSGPAVETGSFLSTVTTCLHLYKQLHSKKNMFMSHLSPS